MLRYYFSWVEEGDAFSKAKHLREDLKIISFDISQQEGEAAILSLKVAGIKKPVKRNCFFSYQDKDGTKLLFAGHLMNMPHQNEDGLWHIEFKSHVDLAKLRELCLAMDVAPFTCPDLYTKEERALPKYVLEGRGGFFNFDRMTGNVSFSDFSRGCRTFRAENIFQGSVKTRLLHLPLQGAEVEITAEWLQRDQGEVDVSDALKRAFPLNYISTFTGDYLERSFPRAGDKLGRRHGRSGCRIVEAALVQVEPPDTGVLKAYPGHSKIFWEYQGDGPPQKNVLKRFWYQAKLVIDWVYKQRREETCRFKLSHQTNFPLTRAAKKIKFHVQPLSDSPNGSFFKTDRGKAALEHALKVAAAHVEASWRMMEVTFELPLKQGFAVSLDHEIDVGDLLGIKKSFIGKVIAYRLCHNGVIPKASIRVGISLQKAVQHNPSFTYAIDAIEGDYTAEHSHFYEVLRNFQPQGICDTKILHTSALIQNVSVTNNAEKQENLLLQPTDGIAVHTNQLLQKHPTSFDITLQDLRTEGVIRASIDLGEVIIKSHTNLNLTEVLHAY